MASQDLFFSHSLKSLSLARLILFLSFSPLPNSKSFTSFLHLLCGLPLPLLPSTFARYALLTNLSSPILSTFPNYFNTFLSILLSTLNSHSHLSLIIAFLTLPTLLMPHNFLKHIIFYFSPLACT